MRSPTQSSSSSSDGTKSSFSSRKFAIFLEIAAPTNNPGMIVQKIPTRPKFTVSGMGFTAPAKEEANFLCTKIDYNTLRADSHDG
jgi:hypothetical protein